MADNVIRSEAGGIVTLTINRPAEKNMLSDEVIELLDRHIRMLDEDGSARVIVITGAGDEFFCGGVFNPSQMHGLAPDQVRVRRRRANELFDRLETVTHPVIAAVNGRAQAGGFELALACDIRVAAIHATFATPENTWGMFPGAGAPLRLPRLVGTGKAMEILMTGWDVTAEEGYRLGLVQRLAPAAAFEAEVRRLAEAIAASGPLGNRAVKKLVRASQETDMRTLRAYSDALREPLAGSADTVEGIAAYREGRRPRFQGR
jgi:enoyl-CoA hydratase/carnithine racemase